MSRVSFITVYTGRLDKKTLITKKKSTGSDLNYRTWLWMRVGVIVEQWLL